MSLYLNELRHGRNIQLASTVPAAVAAVVLLLLRIVS